MYLLKSGEVYTMGARKETKWGNPDLERQTSNILSHYRPQLQIFRYKCIPYPLSRKLLFAADGDHCRKPTAINVTELWSPTLIDTSTKQDPHVRFREHF